MKTYAFDSYGPSASFLCLAKVAPRKHPENIQEAFRRHPRDTQEAPKRHSGGTQEAPRRRPKAPRRHPGDTQEAPGGSESILNKKLSKHMSFSARATLTKHCKN